MDILIRGGRVIDPAQGIDRHVDVWIVDGKIAELGTDLRAPLQRAQGDPSTLPRIIEAQGCAPCHFIGLSMGSFVAMRIAARRPDLVKALKSVHQTPPGLWTSTYTALP